MSGRRPLVRWALGAIALLLLAGLPAAYAVRANWGIRRDGPRLEQLGHHEEAAFYYRAALDFWSVIQQLWMEAVYDPRVDEIYRDYVGIFGTHKGYRGADHEEWQDNEEGCLLFYNRDGAARNVDKGRFSPQARARLEDRLRVYMEDMIDPDHGFGGDFSFSRKAWLLERTGLFWHAALRRELAGRYAIRVCSRYHAAVAEELERVFRDPARAKLYRERAAWWRARGIEELRLSNGDRALARLKAGGKLKKLRRQEVVSLAERGLRAAQVDTRRAAVRILADLGELTILERAMEDREVEIRKAAAAVFAETMHLPGLALARKDRAEQVSAMARAVLDVKPQDVGGYLRAVHFLADGLKAEHTRAFAAEQLRRISGLTPADAGVAWRRWLGRVAGHASPGVRFEYFSDPAQQRPVAAKVLPTIDLGMKLQANFPRVWYDYWDKPEVFPANAEGPFRLRITAKLYVPADGSYRFYAKVDAPNRATVSIATAPGRMMKIISPRGEKALRFVEQIGMPTHRIDFCDPVPLRKGLAALVIDYVGPEVRKIHNEHIVRISGVQKAGIQLFWSSGRFLTELVPARNLFH